jgi:F-type H+-transporting ATPase subunit a
MFAYSPMEGYSVINLGYGLNDVAVFLLFAFGFITVLSYALTKNQTLVPSNWFLGLETYHVTLYSMTRTYIGSKSGAWFPFLYTLFTGLFFSNLFGLLPYSTTPTTHLIVTFNLALFLMLTAIANGFRRYRYAIFGVFIPAGTPLGLIPLIILVEVLAYITRISSLGIRITVNMVTGHTLVKVVGGFIYEAFIGGTSLIILALPIVLLTVFLILELLIAYLQAYIFTFISCITIKDFS